MLLRGLSAYTKRGAYRWERSRYISSPFKYSQLRRSRTINTQQLGSDNMDNDYSDVSRLRPPIHVYEIAREAVGLLGVYGLDSHKRHNLHFIEDGVIVYASGNAVVFENIFSGSKSYLLGMNEEAVGCVAVHPSRHVQPPYIFTSLYHSINLPI